MLTNQTQFHYVYKITNWYNGKEYIGKHSTYNLDDGYMGCGSHLYYAKRKYGLEYFTKEILSFHNSEQEAYDQEGILVDEKYVNDKMTYNIIIGGKDVGMSGYKHSDITKDKISKSVTGENNPFYNKKHSDITKEKISKTNTGRILTEEQRHNQSIGHLNLYKSGYISPNLNVPLTEEHKEKISKANLDYITIYNEKLKKYKRIKEINLNLFLTNDWIIKSPTSERCWISNIDSKQMKFIHNADIDAYLIDKAWVIGKKFSKKEQKNNPKRDGKIWIHNKELNNSTLIKPDELHIWLKFDWELGRLK